MSPLTRKSVLRTRRAHPPSRRSAFWPRRLTGGLVALAWAAGLVAWSLIATLVAGVVELGPHGTAFGFIATAVGLLVLAPPVWLTLRWLAGYDGPDLGR